jgi:Zn-dependent alcohol dehydrogenase
VLERHDGLPAARPAGGERRVAPQTGSSRGCATPASSTRRPPAARWSSSGAPPFGSEVAPEVDGLLGGRRVVGLTLGDSETQSFIPALVGLVKEGRLPLHRLIGPSAFEDIDQAVRAMTSGKTVKPVLTFRP